MKSRNALSSVGRKTLELWCVRVLASTNPSHSKFRKMVRPMLWQVTICAGTHRVHNQWAFCRQGQPQDCKKRILRHWFQILEHLQKLGRILAKPGGVTARRVWSFGPRRKLKGHLNVLFQWQIGWLLLVREILWFGASGAHKEHYFIWKPECSSNNTWGRKTLVRASPFISEKTGFNWCRSSGTSRQFFEHRNTVTRAKNHGVIWSQVRRTNAHYSVFFRHLTLDPVIWVQEVQLKQEQQRVVWWIISAWESIRSKYFVNRSWGQCLQHNSNSITVSFTKPRKWWWSFKTCSETC